MAAVEQEDGSGVDRLKMKFDPLTIEHLGVKMYSHLPNAIAELVANAYDADATLVRVVIEDDGGVQVLTVTDDGHGMSAADIQDKYLRIGRNRRDDEGDTSESGNRRVSGKKGLGKLALFGIGALITVESKREGAASKTSVHLRWNAILESTGGDYYPDAEDSPASVEERGTSIRLSELKRSTPINAAELANSLSRLFNYVDDSFQVVVAGPDGSEIAISPDLRLTSVEIESIWNIPADVESTGRHGFLAANQIEGVVISSVKPLPQGMRGVTLYAHGRLLNEPEFFGASESSFAYSYLSGYLNVDYLDEIVPDVISTDRRTIDWDTEVTTVLQEQLRQLMFTIESQRRDFRRIAKQKEIEKQAPTPITTWVQSVRDGPERRALSEILETLSSPDVEMPEPEQTAFIGLISEIAPPFADLHWRHLHPETQDAAGQAYKEERYYDAADEAIKRYITVVRQRAGIDKSTAMDVINHAFSTSKGTLTVFKKYMDMAGFNFSGDTADNVEEGQRSMSAGIVQGFRNPLAHEEKEKLHDSGAFNHLDCLDALSILSHLHRRLDGAEERQPAD